MKFRWLESVYRGIVLDYKSYGYKVKEVKFFIDIINGSYKNYYGS